MNIMARVDDPKLNRLIWNKCTLEYYQIGKFHSISCNVIEEFIFQSQLPVHQLLTLYISIHFKLF